MGRGGGGQGGGGNRWVRNGAGRGGGDVTVKEPLQSRSVCRVIINPRHCFLVHQPP